MLKVKTDIKVKSNEKQPQTKGQNKENIEMEKLIFNIIQNKNMTVDVDCLQFNISEESNKDIFNSYNIKNFCTNIIEEYDNKSNLSKNKINSLKFKNSTDKSFVSTDRMTFEKIANFKSKSIRKVEKTSQSNENIENNHESIMNNVSNIRKDIRKDIENIENIEEYSNITNDEYEKSAEKENIYDIIENLKKELSEKSEEISKRLKTDDDIENCLSGKTRKDFYNSFNPNNHSKKQKNLENLLKNSTGLIRF